MLALSFAFASATAETCATRAPVVYPSGTTLPVNVLRISIAFDAPQAGPLLGDVALRYANGAPVGTALLDQELWSPDGRVLTLLFDPGRVKTGTVAHAQFGYALVSGRTVNLLLRGVAIKSWRVVRAQRASPDPRRWRVLAPRAGTCMPLRITFDRPIDRMGVDSIVPVSSANLPVAGSAALTEHESAWQFTPNVAWAGGRYRIVIDPRLEDAEGNAIDDPFEQANANARRSRSEPISLPYRVIAPSRWFRQRE